MSIATPLTGGWQASGTLSGTPLGVMIILSTPFGVPQGRATQPATGLSVYIIVMILRILYRIFISYLLATLVSGLVCAIAIGIAIAWFGGFDTALKEGKENNDFKCIFMSIVGSAISCGLAAFICSFVRITATQIAFRRAIYREVIPASIIATLLGLAFGISYLSSPDHKFEFLMLLDVLAGLVGIIIVTSRSY